MKIRLIEGLKQETVDFLQGKAESKKKGKQRSENQPTQQPSTDIESVGVILRFKRYVYDPKKKMIQ